LIEVQIADRNLAQVDVFDTSGEENSSLAGDRSV
jgi:hypothetical protein